MLGLALAWAAIRLAARIPTSRRTYGLRRTTVLAALANALLVLIAVGGVAWEAIERLQDPTDVLARWVMIVAALGVVINGASAALFMRGREHDTNVRAAFLHLATDALVSLGVVIAGALIAWTGHSWIDPVASLVVCAVVVLATWGVLREALDQVLDAVPSGIDPEAVQTFLSSTPHVTEVHDLHIWSVSTTEVALTAHLVAPWASCPPAMLRELATALRERFGIHHVTLQIEPDDAGHECQQADPKHL